MGRYDGKRSYQLVFRMWRDMALIRGKAGSLVYDRLKHEVKGDKVTIGSDIDYATYFPPKRRYTVRGRIKRRYRRKPTVIGEGLE